MQQRAYHPSEQPERNGHRHGNQGSVVSFSRGTESSPCRHGPGWTQCVTGPSGWAQAACWEGPRWPQTRVNVYPPRWGQDQWGKG